MHVLILGGKGMLGRDLVRVIEASGGRALVWDLPEFDITKPATEWPTTAGIDAVVNCAAFTRVDDAEKERDAAQAVNAKGAGHAAICCAARGLRLVHLSTDYVFDGLKGGPYGEDDPTNPLSWYGRTKLEGERAVASSGCAHLIVRTQSLYGVGGRNFVKAILNQVRQGRTMLRVVSDQVSSPTYTLHLAHALLRLLQAGRTGVVNVAAAGWCSWFDFARAILEEAGIAGVGVEPSSAREMNFPAHRPAFSALDMARYAAWTGAAMPSWREGLRAYLVEEPLAGGGRGAAAGG